MLATFGLVAALLIGIGVGRLTTKALGWIIAAILLGATLYVATILATEGKRQFPPGRRRRHIASPAPPLRVKNYVEPGMERAPASPRPSGQLESPESAMSG